MKPLHSRLIARLAADYRLQVLLTILIVIAAAGGWYVTHRNIESTDNATVQCELVDVVSEVRGVIEAIHFKDDQFVERGAPLLKIEDPLFRAQLARAGAQLGIAKSSYLRAHNKEKLLAIELPADLQKAGAASASSAAVLRSIESSIQEAQEELKAAAANVEFYKQNQAREGELHALHAIATKEFDSTRRSYAVTLANQAALEAKIAKLEQLREAETWNVANARTTHATLAKSKDYKRENELAEAMVEQDRIAVAQAEYDTAKLNLERTTSRAKLAGMVTNRRISVGEYIEVGQRVASIVSCQAKPWINANFKETQISRMRAGQRAEFTIDSYPGVTFRGTLESISGGSGSTFSVLPPENATGNFTKVVKRMPVKIRLDGPTDKLLRVGASAEVKVFLD